MIAENVTQSISKRAPSLAFLGIDAGGTATRWVAVDVSGNVVVDGELGGLSALMLNDELGRETLRRAMVEIQAQVDACEVVSICAGFTGVDSDSQPLTELLAESFALPQHKVRIVSDIELACHSVFAPGQGYVVYAGTGSIAAFLDAEAKVHRAGGRGVQLDDGGGGYWIAREALRNIWRAEDKAPGSWKDSVLAFSVFGAIGGSDWADTRQFFYTRSRGEIGQLALAVAAVADKDSSAKQILDDAADELFRLAEALYLRYGPRPTVLLGRAASLHPCIRQRFTQRLQTLQVSQYTEAEPFVLAEVLPPQHAAAKLALVL